jgi:hypothetical protein
LISVEARLSAFNDKGRAQSLSNAIDAMCLCPKQSRRWPILNFEIVLGPNGCSVVAFALVPISDVKAKQVEIWRSQPGVMATAIYDVVVAATLAAKDFRECLAATTETPTFCKPVRTIAIQDEAIFFKSFFDSEYRSVNLDLVKKFIDPQAEEITLGTHGSYLKMRRMGYILKQDKSCDSSKFVEAGNALRALHEMGKCHGDIRLLNLLPPPFLLLLRTSFLNHFLTVDASFLNHFLTVDAVEPVP